MKRFMAILLAAALSVGILAGCGTNTASSTTKATGETTKAATEKKNIVLWYYWGNGKPSDSSW